MFAAFLVLSPAQRKSEETGVKGRGTGLPPVALRSLAVQASIGICLMATGAIAASTVGSHSDANELELFFREDWKETPAETPVTQDHVSNPDLILTRHGPARDWIRKSHHDDVPNDPWYVWSGSCKEGRWAISLRKENRLVDLSENGRIRWRTCQSGPHVLKVILELEDGTWLVSNKGFGETPDWHEFCLDLGSLKWYELDIRMIKPGTLVNSPNLRRVRSIGWTDLMVGEGSGGCTRVDWIEVYGKSIQP